MTKAILNECRPRLAVAAAGAATSAVVGDIIDCAGAESVVFFATIATANAGNYLKVDQGDNSSLTDAAEVTGSTTRAVAAANGDIVAVEIVRPTKRYLRPTIVRGASSATGDLYCVIKGARKLPVDNDVSDIIVSSVIVSA